MSQPWRTKLAVALTVTLCVLALLWLAEITNAQTRGGPCDGCEAWVQGPFDLDPGTRATATLVLDQSVIELVLDAGAAGECGPGPGTSCSVPLADCTASVAIFGTLQPGYTAWYHLPGGLWAPLAPRGYVGTLFGPCDSYRSTDVVIFAPDFTFAESFVRWGCFSCPEPN